MKPAITTLLLLLATFAFASDIPFPEAGFTLNLPDQWQIADQGQIDDINRLLRSDPKTRTTQYYKKIDKIEPQACKDAFPTYILVQLIDMPLSPESMVRMFPSIESRAMDKSLDVRNLLELDAKYGKATFDPLTNTAVIPLQGANASGQQFSGFTVVIPTKQSTICLHAYADRRHATDVLQRLLPSLQSPTLAKDLQVDPQWKDTLRRLLLKAVSGKKQ